MTTIKTTTTRDRLARIGARIGIGDRLAKLVRARFAENIGNVMGLK
jgi:hypothetical protein